MRYFRKKPFDGGVKWLDKKSRMISRTTTILTVCGTKGGVGKTTLCANLAGIVSDWGWNVLMIDTDTQPSLSRYFPITHPAEFGISRLLSHAEVEQSISKTALPRLDIVVSDTSRNECDELISQATDGLNRIKASLLSIANYDLVVIDTKGSASPMLEAALIASDQILCPIVPDMLSTRELVRNTFQIICQLKSSFAISHQSIAGVLYKTRKTLDGATITRNVQSLFDGASILNVLRTDVPDRVIYKDAATAQLPVHLLEKSRRNGLSANETMQSLAHELLPVLKQ